MDLTHGFDGISYFSIVLVGSISLIASIIAGVTGYGNSVLLPLVLVPLVGPEPVVPIIAVAALSNNITRATAFRPFIDWKRAMIVIVFSLPTCALGAYVFTKLTSAGILTVIGAMLMLSVPVRHWLLHLKMMIGDRGLATASVGFGFLSGSTTGSGAILLSLLMAAGVSGAGVIATDAVISTTFSVTKMIVFGASGVMTAQIVAFGLLIGLMALPGAFLARTFVERIPLHVHTGILDAVVVFGGAVMIFGAIRQ
jgi:uncharacterized membrane protein YfcA